MSHSISNPLASACLRLLRPLARVLLRHGVSAHEFTRLAHIAFIQGAADILQEQDQPANFSRISTITGLHRHVVSSLAGATTESARDVQAEKDYQRNRLARVLSGWFESPDYTDAQGRPLVLPLEGPGASFNELVRAFSGDIYPRIILDELVRVGAVRVLRDGSVRAVARRYTVGGAHPDALRHLGTVASDLLCTLEHNLSAPAETRLFEDSVVSIRLDARALPLLRQLLQRRGTSFLQDIEGWLAEHEITDKGDTIRAGVTVQMFLDEESPRRR